MVTTNLLKWRIWMFMAAILLLNGPMALAKHEGGAPHGFSHGDKKGWKGEHVPPGWSKGEKKGWHGASTPPGLAKKAGDGQNETSKVGNEGKEKEGEDENKNEDGGAKT